MAGDVLQEGPHHVRGQDIGAVRLAGMQLDGDGAPHPPVDAGVNLKQTFHADVGSKKHLRLVLRSGGDRFRPRNHARGQGSHGGGSALEKRTTGNMLGHIRYSMSSLRTACVRAGKKKKCRNGARCPFRPSSDKTALTQARALKVRGNPI